MTQLSYQIPISGEPNSSADPKVRDALQQIVTVVNGSLGSDNLPIGTFLQLAIAGTAWKINCGQLPLITWPGATSSISVLNVPHGLTAVRALIVGNGGGGAGGGGVPWVTSPGNITATTFDVYVSTRDGSTTGAFTTNANTTPYWVAIGT